jgi:peptide/nickel transport system ATP-binding protein
MAGEKTELLRVEGLKKYFNTHYGILHAVDDVSFTVRKGETLGVVGESGCGKSTLGRAILRLQEPTAGRVFFEGYNILTYGKNSMKALRRDMQIIFQDPFASLNPRMSVSETICEALLIQKL